MSPEHVGAGIRWIRQDTEHPRMGQSTPEQFAIPGAAVRSTWKAKTQPLEALDYGVRTALSFEQFEHRSNGALYFLVRIERNLVVVKNQTHRQREVQFTLVRLVELAAVEARADDVKLCLGERALHAKHEAVVELGRVVTAVLVDYQRAGDGAQLEQAVPVLVGARQARSFEGEDCTPPRLRVSETTSSLIATRPKASVINGSPPAGVTCALGGAQSVHSRGIANEPNSEWRRLRVSTPETLLTFKTTNR